MKIIPLKVDGILLLDKPAGITSNGALQRIKRLFNAKKAGHTGSLDPLATGMLPICFGSATRVSQFLLDSDKHYRVTATLGIKTTTGDTEGEAVSVRPVENITEARVISVLEKFTGTLEQIPPMFSAVKHQGKPLYKLARQGIEVERKPRTVHIHALQLIALHENTFDFDVHCSKGTYVRTLVEDMGEMLGCGAHVSALRRIAVSPYEKDAMYTLAELEEALQQCDGPVALKKYLLAVDTSVQHFPVVKLSSSATFYIRTGQAVRVPGAPTQGWVRIFADDDKFIGIGEINEDGRVAPRRLVEG